MQLLRLGQQLSCSFCRKPQSEGLSIASADKLTYICTECALQPTRLKEILQDTRSKYDYSASSGVTLGVSMRAVKCSFCSKDTQLPGLYRSAVHTGTRAHICTDCLNVCRRILRQKAVLLEMSPKTPVKISIRKVQIPNVPVSLAVIGTAWLLYISSWFFQVIKIGTKMSEGRLPGAEALFSALFQTGVEAPVLTKFMMALSALTNFAMVTSPLILVRSHDRHKVSLFWLSTLSAILNAQWFIWILSEGRADLRAGYYLWWASFCLLALGLFLEPVSCSKVLEFNDGCV